ncbi:MAG: PorV/PorQ family protein, partial [Candidatus Krumholzibacteria bacterium]|nr:PorV/PorQ family protein [Candidatus Krumholzibacteria bacterium]
MKRLEAAIILSIVVLGSAVDLCAQDGSGGTRSIFSVGAGSRAISMGGAFTAIGDDPSAIYYNPAVVRVNRHACVMVNHIQLFSGFSDASYDYIGLVYPTLSVGSVGLGFMTVGTDGIREFDRKGVYQDDISYREWQAMLAYAFDLPWTYIGKVTMGSSVKILNQSVGDFSDTGAGLDVGFLCRPPYTGGLVLGCNLQDIVGAEIKLVAVSEKVDRTLMFGAGYSYLFKNGSMLSLAVQMDMPERADRDLRFGAEYSFRQTISFRVGFDSEQVTAGVGFGWRGFEADYGYFSREEAGSSHPISLSARIGVSIDDKIRVREERRMIEEERRLQQLFAERVSSHIATAENCRREGDLEKALDELKIVLEYDPSNNAAAETLIVVRGEILREQEKRTRTAEKALLISQYFKLGLKYYSSNEYILARAEWQNVLNLEPPNEEARDYLSRTEEKLTEQVNQHMSRAVKLENSGQLAAALGEWSI